MSRGSGIWEPIGFYLLIPKEANVIFACRLGFYSSMNTGRAWFRDLSVVKVDAPASDGDPSFKLDSVDQTRPPKNRPNGPSTFS